MNLFRKIFPKKEKILEKEVLLEMRSPLCPIIAIVEQDENVAYFYLWSDTNISFGIKSCWIRNLKPASNKINTKSVRVGNAPMMPKGFCKFPQGQKSLDKDKLNIVWTEEGDAAALYEGEEIISIIPSWSNRSNFFGYARDCKGQGNFAWELKSDNVFTKRIAKAQMYWKLWDAELSPFSINQPIILKNYDETLGKSDKYYAIDGGKWPPKGLFVRKGEKVVFTTVGVSLIPIPQIEIHAKPSSKRNRIEIGLILNNSYSESQFGEIAKWISSVAHIPWDNICALGEGHTVNFHFPDNEIFKAALLSNKINIFPKIELEEYRGSEVHVLWLIPISLSERKYIMKNGSDDFLKELNSIGQEIFSLNRKIRY